MVDWIVSLKNIYQSDEKKGNIHKTSKLCNRRLYKQKFTKPGREYSLSAAKAPGLWKVGVDGGHILSRMTVTGGIGTHDGGPMQCL